MSPAPVRAPAADIVQAQPATPVRLDLTRSGPFFAGLLVLAVVAFWPSYLSRFAASSGYTHLHAGTATLWLLFLIAQPTAIRTRRLRLHRALGRASYGLAAAVVLSIVFLAHSRIDGVAAAAFARRSYFLYLQISLAVLFSGLYTLAVAFRKTTALHSRFMACTALTLIDPILIRMVVRANPFPGLNYQWLTFGATNVVLLALIWLDRDARRGRWVFPAVLATFMVAQAPALLGWTGAAWWQAFARWFQGLGIT